MSVVKVVDVSLLLNGVDGSAVKNVDPELIEIHCGDPSKLFFTITSDDAVQFSIYSTDPTVKKTTALQTIVSKKAAGQDKYTASAAGLLLEAGNYFVTVKLTGRSDESEYTIGLDGTQTIFYDQADNGANNWLYDAKTKTVNANVVAPLGGKDDPLPVAIAGYHLVDVDAADADEHQAGNQGFVGYQDAADYRQFTLGSAAKLSFDVEATDAVKFTVYSLTASLDKSGNTVYAQKALQTSTAKLNKETGKYEVTTAALLLDNADASTTYYLAMESTNAAKGGNAIYTVAVNDASRFYTLGDGSTATSGNGWLYDAKTKTVNDVVVGEAGAAIDRNTGIIAIDAAEPSFVGYGDAADYRKITLNSAATLSFDVEATDAVKFTVYSLTASLDKSGNTVYTQKALQSSTAKLNKETGNYEVTTAGLLIAEPDPNVSYYLAMESTNAAKGGYAVYSVEVNDASRFYTQGDDGDNNWLYDAKTKTPNAAVVDEAGAAIDRNTGIIAIDTTLPSQNFVGYGDAADYRKIELTSAATLSFDVEATDAVKFTVYSLTESWDKQGNSVFTQKALQSSTAKLNKETGKYEVTTAALLLDNADPGTTTYYLAMESTNAAKGGYAEYSVAVNDSSIFYTRGDSGWNNWLYDAKNKEVNDAVVDPKGPGAVLPVAITGHHYVEIDEKDADDQVAGKQSFVGYEDTTDYRQFTLNSAAKLSFDVEATDAMKFTVVSLTASLDKSGNTVYTQKALQTSTAKLNKETGKYEVTTAALLIDNTDPASTTTYYLAAESTNAAKGGSAVYTVNVNGDSRFYTLGDNGDNDWLYDAKTKTPNDAVTDGPVTTIDGDTGAVVIDLTAQGFVGYGDTADYRKIELEHAAKLSFDVEAADAVKFTVYSLTESPDKTGKTVYTQKALQTSTAKLDKETGKYKVTTAGLLLDNAADTTYYLAMESTNAAKGGYATYSVAVNDGSVFYTKGNNTDDSWEDAGIFGNIPADPDTEIRLENGWVGFGDTVDFQRFSVMEDMSVNFSIDASGPVKFTVYQLDGGKLKSLQSTTVKAGVSTATKALALKEGEYYFAVESTDAAKGGSADYTVIGSRYVAPLNITTNGNGLAWDGWMDLEEARIDTPIGTAGADKITFAGNCAIYVPDILNMKGSDDTVTVNASTKRADLYAGGEIVFDTIEMGDGNDKLVWGANTEVYWTTVNLGDGNDTFQLAANGISNGTWMNYEWVNTLDFGDGNDCFELGSNSWFSGGSNGIYVDFGDGDDTMKMAANSTIHEWHDDTYFRFGDGNDKLTIAKGAGIMKVTLLDFGSGDDTMTVDQGNGGCRFDSLDFGDGDDTLVLNGRLDVGEITNVERVSGKGFVFLTGENDDYQAGDYAAFTDGGVAVVQGFAKDGAYGDNSRICEYDCFSDPQSELADNVMGKARSLETEYESRYASFWLCGEETADELAYGFTDETDYIKLVVDRSMQGKTLSVGAFVESGFSLELLDGKGNAVQGPDENPVVLYSGDDLDLADLATGTYYMKLSVASSGYACGSVAINPTAWV